MEDVVLETYRKSLPLNLEKQFDLCDQLVRHEVWQHQQKEGFGDPT